MPAVRIAQGKRHFGVEFFFLFLALRPARYFICLFNFSFSLYFTSKLVKIVRGSNIGIKRFLRGIFLICVKILFLD